MVVLQFIFAHVGEKMRINIEELRVELEAQEGDTIEAVRYKLFVKTDAPLSKVERCLELTEKTCPVGVLYHRAGVPFEYEIVML